MHGATMKMYIVASFWIITDTYYAMQGPLKIKMYSVLLLYRDVNRRINFKAASARYIAFRNMWVGVFQYQPFDACRLHHILAVLHDGTHAHTHTHTRLFISIFPDNPQKNLGYSESTAIRQRSRPTIWLYPMLCRLPDVPFASTFFSLLLLYVFPLKDARPVRYFYLSCFLLRACSTYFHFLMLSCHITFPVLFCYKASATGGDFCSSDL